MKSEKVVFVFGSNESGVHGSGAAKTAKEKFGAIYGVGFGPQGLSFGIPTKDWEINSLGLPVIQTYVDRFIAYAKLFPDVDFKVTKIGCGLAGFTDQQIAPLFVNAPTNCLFDSGWKMFLGDKKQYWGTF